MIIIAGMWELSWDTPMMEMLKWETITREFEVDELYMSPISGIKNKWVTETASIHEVIEKYKDIPRVYLAEDGEIPLKEFEHPKDALYLFGRGNYSPFNDIGRNDEKGYSVKIETPAKKGLLLASSCAGIILYDRYNKWHLQ